MGSLDTNTEDAALLRRAVEDDVALGTLYQRYVRRVTAFAARRCVSADDVADAVAETFDRLLRSAHRYDATRGSVASFVFAVADSTVADQRRRAARQQALTTRLGDRAGLRGHDLLDDDDIARIEAAIDAASSVAALTPALDALTDGESEVLRLVADGLSPSEAAHELGITPNAARVRLARARRQIRSHPAAVDPAQPPAPTR
ncbi:MAG TPA: sigma-70 family RNA polymerase sigma factor [Acidimicrobiales bacterium]|jgi:RNA polymerase sigma factor (sigma-70 family)|nr:sigma-70 family RNA polymerase sigma factor [Acidimicrobiales bacterium]